MKNNVLKGVMVFFLSGLMLANVNVIFAEHPSEQHLDTIEGGSGGSGENSGWFWKSREESCTYSVTITLGGGLIPGSWSRTDTYNGKRTVCDDGWSVCWSTMCH